MSSRQIVLVAHDVRSCYNVGAMLRTAEGLGINHVYLTGYTPYPQKAGDSRLPHLSQKITKQIHKTALGAEALVSWTYEADVIKLIDELRSKTFVIAAVEQTPTAINLAGYHPPPKIVVIVGNEIQGVSSQLQKITDLQLAIPMLGQKESFNVTVAAAMALYHLRFS